MRQLEVEEYKNNFNFTTLFDEKEQKLSSSDEKLIKIANSICG